MSSTKFLMTRDIGGYNGFGIVPAKEGFSGLLAADIADSVTVPSEYSTYLAIFSFTPGANVFVDCSTTAVSPSGVLSASTARLNPSARQVTGGSTISFITPDTNGAYVTVEFYVVSPYTN